MSNSLFRFVHNIAPGNLINDLSADVFIGAKKILENITYGFFSDYLKVPAGQYTITVKFSAGFELKINVNFKPRKDYSVVAIGLVGQDDESEPQLKLIRDQLNDNPNTSKLRFAHGAASVSVVDFYVDGELFFSDVGYCQVGIPEHKYLSPGVHQIRIDITNDPVIETFDYIFEKNGSYTFMLSGIHNSPNEESGLSVIVISHD